MRKVFIIAFALLLSFQSYARDVWKDSLDFDRMNSSTPADMLRGKVSGVMVSSGQGGINDKPVVTIRGTALRSVSNPLWIIDGAVLSSSIAKNLFSFQGDVYGEQAYVSPKNDMDFLNPYDIESIEVLKDATAAALYGSRGADGVIIIKTKKAEKEGDRIDVVSNFGMNMDASSLKLSPGFSNSTSVNYSSGKGQNSYRVGVWFRTREGTVSRDNSMVGGLNVNFDVRSNKTVWFGLKASMSIGDSNSQYGTAWYGRESAMELLRTTGSYQSFIKDYDDNSRNYRTVNSAYLQINILPTLHWTTDFGLDYQNDMRYLWYGKGTQFGAAYNGAAAIATSSLLDVRVSTKFDYDVYVATRHHLSAMAGVEYYVSNDRLNNQEGTNFFNHELRAKGLSYNGDKTALHKYNSTLSHLGVFGKIGYDYDRIAGVDVIFRADDAFRYDDGRFSLYPSGTLWFDIHRLFRDFKPVSSLKLSGGYGKTGKDISSPYELFKIYCPGIEIPGFQTGTESLYEGMARTRSGEWHVRLDAGFISDRLTLGLTWYDRQILDSFSWYCFGYDSGRNNRWKKGARRDLGRVESSLRNKGLEVDLGARIIDNGNLVWTADFNIAWQSNDKISIAPQDNGGDYFGSGLYAGFEWNKSPSIFGGLLTRLSFSGLTFELGLDGVSGKEVLNLNRMFRDGCTVASLDYVDKADFLRLNKAAVSYKIPLKSTVVKELRINLEGLNLATLSTYSGWNPDVNSYSKSAFTQGADYASFPIYSTVMLGFKIKF